MDIITEINQLKKEKNAIVLAHNYQRPEIYKVADFIGDSLDLSRAAVKTDAERIVFCGVDFMAESAKLLNPEKTVLHPDKEARCPMAAMVNADSLRKMKEDNPDAAVVCYINTSAAVKAESDVCCTSANAVQIVNSLPNEEIIFVPDRHLGRWVQKQTKKKLIFWDGYCYVHSMINANDIEMMKKTYPEAEVLVHPESPLDVIGLADKVAGTMGMVKYAKESDAKEFIVGTEEGMTNRLAMEMPDKKFHAGAGVCVNMKKITLEKVKEALETVCPKKTGTSSQWNLHSIEKNQYEVVVPGDVAMRARRALERMLEISAEE